MAEDGPAAIDGAPTDRMPDRAPFAARVHLTKREAFRACQALADADRLLVAAGGMAEAGALGDLFELLEDRLTTPTTLRALSAGVRGGGASARSSRRVDHDVGPGQESVGAYSMEREFTQ